MERRNISVKLQNRFHPHFAVGIWRYPANTIFKVSREEYKELKQAIETQKPSIYGAKTTLTVIENY